MQKFVITLTKSYLVEINATDEEQAKNLVTFFTSDISDLSNDDDKNKYQFSIETIKCVENEAFDCQTLEY
ncbi:hypothetical protein AD998_13200 [bacterium 336/3]|nr:hypothetical protein AD998_13200 [bacterium 336/3]